MDLTYEKLQVRVRLREADYKSLARITEAGQEIVDAVNDFSFSFNLINALNETSSLLDGLDYSRYGWMTKRHILVKYFRPSNVYIILDVLQVMNCFGFPVGSDRAHDAPGDETSSNQYSHEITSFDLIIIGVALGCLLLASLVTFWYCKIKRQYGALVKDKVDTLSEKWRRFRLEQSAAQKKTKYEPVRTTELVDFGAAEFDTSLEADEALMNRH